VQSFRAVFFLLIFACIGRLGMAKPNLDHIPWTSKDVIGLSMTLNDQTRIERFAFFEGGGVPATLGKVKNGQCSVIPPAYRWKIVSGRLKILTEDGQLIDELTLISRNASTLRIRKHSGELAEYEYLMIYETKKKR